MGAKSSRTKLPAEDLEFLMVNTRYDENTINEWYKGFRQVSGQRGSAVMPRRRTVQTENSARNYSRKSTASVFQPAMPRSSVPTSSAHSTGGKLTIPADGS